VDVVIVVMMKNGKFKEHALIITKNNLYDPNGLSPYHLCIIQQQRKGLEYML